jgi:hypothetical protein
MNEQESRRKIEKKASLPIAPKKRGEAKEEPVSNKEKQVDLPSLFESKPDTETVSQGIEPQPQVQEVKLNIKYFKIASDAGKDAFKNVGDRVQKGELKWSHYCTDGTKGAHYYIEINK